jgi:hypothetical protein
MNIENILKLADYIEKSDDFDMPRVGKCITGHSYQLFGKWASETLGLEDGTPEYQRLIMPPGWHDSARYPKERAVATLRRLASDGLPVNWGPDA